MDVERHIETLKTHLPTELKCISCLRLRLQTAYLTVSKKPDTCHPVEVSPTLDLILDLSPLVEVSSPVD